MFINCLSTFFCSFLAATGLPNPQKNHHLIMCRFATECLNKMKSVTRELEPSLGAGTTELALRVGLHCGPVTAGVLRGHNARFQLFGDTMNTASRMESTGVREKIHISQELRDLLVESGKERWVIKRDDEVVAKGKGVLSTYWLKMNHKESYADSTETTMTSCSSSRGLDSSDSENLKEESTQTANRDEIFETTTIDTSKEETTTQAEFPEDEISENRREEEEEDIHVDIEEGEKKENVQTLYFI